MAQTNVVWKPLIKIAVETSLATHALPQFSAVGAAYL